ncbi:MAG: ABC transporter permease subunit [Methylacidiphilales bacterium]|nr:ABC transporter permease subunit [Candidatus Methylacidiphilales bacterium]
MIFTIALLDLKRNFKTPLAWIIIGITQLIFSYFLFVNTYFYSTQQDRIVESGSSIGITSSLATPTLSIFMFIAIFIVPLLSIRLLGEERANNTITLLLSSPISIPSLVLGKFFGILLFCLLILALQVISIIFYFAGETELNYLHLASASLGMLLILSLYCSVSLFCSTIFNNSLTIAIASFSAIALVWLIGISSSIINADGFLTTLRQWLSLGNHTDDFFKGVLSFNHGLYFVVMTFSFLILTYQNLESYRLSGKQ